MDFVIDFYIPIVPVCPKYSFVQIGDPDTQGCNDDPKFCLPISSTANLKFEVQLNQTGTLTGSYHIFAVPVPCDADCADAEEAPSITTSPYDLSGDTATTTVTLLSLLPYALIISGHQHQLTSSNVMAYFDTVPSASISSVFAADFDSRASLGVPDTRQVEIVVHYSSHDSVLEPLTSYAPANILTTIDTGQCFKLQYIYEAWDSSGNVTVRHYIGGCSNCFIRTPEHECYSSVLSYTNSDNAFGFDYTDYSGTGPFSNVVELPMYLRDPVMENDQKVYTKSDGSIVKLYERKEEKYILETDLMPYAWHKALDIALSHDTVKITNPNASAFDPVNTATRFVKSENYQIEYMKAPLSSLGKATCKLSNATPINLINNNCG